MSDLVAENVGALVRRVSRHLNRKITDVLALLLRHKSAGSLGAVAGFAIAVVFAWKFLGPSRGRRTSNRRKPRASPSTSREAAGADPSLSEGFMPVSPLKVSDAIEAVAPAVEVDFWVPMTCQLLGVILDEKTPEELQERVLSALENGGVFQKGSLIKDKVSWFKLGIYFMLSQILDLFLFVILVFPGEVIEEWLKFVGGMS
ncbi:hypothetical protein BHE74_00016091 [Ensete ventricosum]|uniref:Uncharacterized protein n=1 Tax=Ensete ventricosum TaxID=4639 RepID=A0A444DYM0_ENSVE|nr:hypothetical protein B296_00017777 [Ensete ventricosum]RWW03229.1 hypothetical protein GW17_00033627 [Ensete ventricosum]RWW75853.1 hypothetical protein BHE74_00016091 [Ensete ventricosum]